MATKERAILLQYEFFGLTKYILYISDIAGTTPFQLEDEMEDWMKCIHCMKPTRIKSTTHRIRMADRMARINYH